MAEQLANTLVELFRDKIPAELTIFIVSMMPILELRGGLIAAKLLDVSFLKAFTICFAGNILPIPFILLFINKIFKFMRRFSFFDKIVDKLESKGEKNREKVMRYETWGLLVFVAIPLPGTGGWTGALIAALLDMDWKKSFVVISIGVLIAGIIMSLLTYGVSGLIELIR